MSVTFVSIIGAIPPPPGPPIDLVAMAAIINASAIPAPALVLSPADANLRPTPVVNASSLPVAVVSLSPPTQNLRPAAVTNASAVQPVSLVLEPSIKPAAIINASGIPAVRLVEDVDVLAAFVVNLSAVPSASLEEQLSGDGEISSDAAVLNVSQIKNPTIFGPFIFPVQDPLWDNVVLFSDANFTPATSAVAGANRAAGGLGWYSSSRSVPKINTTTKPAHLATAIETQLATGVYMLAADPSGYLALGSVAFTIEGWIYTTWSNNTRFNHLISRWKAGTLSYALGLSADIDFAPSRYPVFAMSANGSTFVSLRSPDQLPAGQWAYLSVDRDAAGDVRLYVNGVMKAKATFPAFFNPTGFADIRGMATFAENGDGFYNELRVTRSVARFGSDAGHAAPTQSLTVGTQGRGDFFWDDVVFASHCDDGNDAASRFIKDLSKIGHASDQFNAAITYVDGGKFGRAISNPAAGYYTIAVSNPSAAAFNMSGVAFTAEAWVYRTAASASRLGILGFYRSAGSGRQWSLNVINNKPEVILSRDGVNLVIISGTADLPLNTWAHLAMDRTENGVTRLYVNGVMVAKDTSLTGMTLNGTTLPAQLDIMCFNGAASGPDSFVGRLDDIRITREVARYASDSGFTAPTTAFDAFQLLPAGTLVSATDTVTPTTDLVEHTIEIPAPAIEDEVEAVVNIPDTFNTLPVGTRIYFQFPSRRWRKLRFTSQNLTLLGIIRALRRRRTYIQRMPGGVWVISGGDDLPDPKAAYKFWRVLVTATGAAQGYTAVSEIEFKATSADADQATGGVASADSVYSTQAAALAFDNSNTTFWESGGTATDHWLRYEFAAPVVVGCFTLRTHSAFPDETPSRGYVQYSSDGVIWYTAWEWSIPTPALSTTYTFIAPWSS